MSARLPNCACAEIEERKIVDYLLKLAHPDGGSKAKFFLARGFAVAEWQTMRVALQVQGRDNFVTRVTQHPWGARYQVDCNCPTPDGSNPCIRSVWELPDPTACPRLITAHPLQS